MRHSDQTKLIVMILCAWDYVWFFVYVRIWGSLLYVC